MNEDDYEKGKRIFKLRCLHCHVIDTTAPKIGPSLNGIMGRTSGIVPGYNYSEANKNKKVVWTRETLDEFLTNPKKFMPGTQMLFAGMKKADDRAILIKYIEFASAKKPS